MARCKEAGKIDKVRKDEMGSSRKRKDKNAMGEVIRWRSQIWLNEMKCFRLLFLHYEV